ncbi:hypothetical protein SAMN04487995_1788 [Dyadobacter koreensis]|uniref:Uncharacterized protein n=1 Tax=Dyadobacter koreensis TaxID=408657 RepID=A0A1H6SR64_9BACT|nr:hypothetical protein [Dyadobacter koreensis]SEI70353.1 hypothetical protein SAMN04487995_1788 [Dyadobacter koreensis]
MEVKETETGLDPEKVIQILKKHGESISLEEAKNVVKLIHQFARIAVNQLTKAK